MPKKFQLNLTPRIKIWFETDGTYAFGFGLCEILSAVQETGSLKEAAQQIGRSYRYVWGRVKDAETILNRPLVQTRVGGKREQRSELTADAEILLQRFMTLRQTMKETLDREFESRFGKKSPE